MPQLTQSCRNNVSLTCTRENNVTNYAPTQAIGRCKASLDILERLVLSLPVEVGAPTPNLNLQSDTLMYNVDA